MKFSRLLILISVLMLALGCAGGQAPTPEPNIDREAQESVLTEINYDTWVPMSFAISPDLKKIAYVNKVDDQQVVVVNGKEQKRYKQVAAYYLTFSPDSQRLAYAAHGEEEKVFMVVDGKEGKGYDDIGAPIFSKDSKRVAYIAMKDNKWIIVVDEQEGERLFDEIVRYSLVFTPDNRDVAYVVRLGDKLAYQLGNKGGKLYDEIVAVSFSPDSRHVVYMAREGNKWLVVRDETAGKQYDEIEPDSIAFSPDSQRLVYKGRSGTNWFVVVDGKESKPYAQVDVGKHSFSPDNKRFAYAAASDDKAFVVIDGKEEKQYLGIGIGSTVFSPNSQHLAYVAALKGCQHSDVPEQEKEAHKSEEEACIVVDGKEGKGYNLIGAGPVFSPDSKHVAYAVWIKDGWFLIKDSTEYKRKYDGIGPNTLVFSPDSKHVAYASKIGEKFFVEVDGQKGKQYDQIATVLGGKIVFDSDNRLRYIAAEGSKILLVEEKITEKLDKP